MRPNMSTHTSAQVDAGKAAREYSAKVDPDMENHSCEEALDCLYSIYKVSEPCAHIGSIAPYSRCLALTLNSYRQHHYASRGAAHCARPGENLLSRHSQWLV